MTKKCYLYSNIKLVVIVINVSEHIIYFSYVRIKNIKQIAKTIIVP